jgi:hypothetical protein
MRVSYKWRENYFGGTAVQADQVRKYYFSLFVEYEILTLLNMVVMILRAT